MRYKSGHTVRINCLSFTTVHDTTATPVAKMCKHCISRKMFRSPTQQWLHIGCDFILAQNHEIWMKSIILRVSLHFYVTILTRVANPKKIYNAKPIFLKCQKCQML